MTIDFPKFYYYIKPLLPRKLQIFLRRKVALEKRKFCSEVWPIDRAAASKPAEWQGWPGSKPFSFVLTHDVDTARGHDKCWDLAEIEMSLGFRSSFNFVAGEYKVSEKLRYFLSDNGFEVGIHGWHHNNSMYKSKEDFSRQALEINRVLKTWSAVGFRSPCMYHKLDWLHELNILYDASTFDTDPFEPQPDGVGTIFPFLVFNKTKTKDYVELPYTLPQDFTLFILLQEQTSSIWAEKTKWVAGNGGMVLINTHPDYMDFSNGSFSYKSYPVRIYEDFLKNISTDYDGLYWHALPKEIALHVRSNLTTKTKIKDETGVDVKELASNVGRINLNDVSLYGENPKAYERWEA